MSRMSLESAKMVLRNRGYMTTGSSKEGYRVYKDGIDHTTLVTGRGVVKFAKEVMESEEERNRRIVEESKKGNRTISEDVDPEILSEMRSVWGPGTRVVNVITGEYIDL